jgi:hypothetical protein
MRIRIDEELDNATFSINNLVEDQVLHNQKPSVISKVDFGNFKFLKGYLIIAISSRGKINNATKWKIALNGIALTREFKPHLESRISENIYQALFVYDVSKILNTIQPLALFKMKYEEKEPITINAVSLITLHQYNESNVKIACVAEALSLDNYVLDLSQHVLDQKKYKESMLYLGIVSEQGSKLKLNSSDSNLAVHNLGRGFNFIETSLRSAKTDKLILKGEDPLTRHIFHCIAHTTLEYPSITIKQYLITSNNNYNYLELVLANESPVDADDCEVIVFKMGIPIQRLSLGPFNAGEGRSIKIPLLNKISGRIVVRLVWRKALKTLTRDQIIELK